MQKIIIAFILVAIVGCQKPSFRQKFGWKAEDYFIDSKVVELCHAIEKKDLAKIDKLIAEGADVNAKGQGNMTPLLWAYPENNLDVFTKILEHGADPNVQFTSDFNTKMNIEPGSSVIELAAGTWFPGYFKAVMEHGGNPNLVSKGRFGNTLLHSVIQGYAVDKKENLKLLIDAGADLNLLCGAGRPPLAQAVSWGGQYDLAIQLVEAGADWELMYGPDKTTVLHLILDENEGRLPVSKAPAHIKASYDKLVDILKAKGADFEEAKRDQELYRKYSGFSPEIIKKEREKIIKYRMERYEKKRAAKEEEKRG